MSSLVYEMSLERALTVSALLRRVGLDSSVRLTSQSDATTTYVVIQGVEQAKVAGVHERVRLLAPSAQPVGP
jgi:hypothetical protein